MESEKPVVDFARVRTFTCVIVIGERAGGGRAITGQTRRRSRPMTGPRRLLRTINIVGSGTPKTPVSQYRERDRGSTSAPGRRVGESPPTPQSDAAGRGRDVRVKRRAAAGSPALWRTCQKADVQRDEGTRSPTGCLVWETTGPPPSDAAG